MKFIEDQLMSFLLKLLVTLSLLQANEPITTPTTASCGTNQAARDLAHLIIEDSRQQRSALTCDRTLTEIATERANWLANNPYEEDSANQFAERRGFRLPDYYPLTGNQVETYTINQSSAAVTFEELINNTKHQRHVLGGEAFFDTQDRIGVGYHQSIDSPKGHWVVLITAAWQAPKVRANIKFNHQWKQPKGCDKDWKNSKDEYLKRTCRSLSER